MTDVRFFHKCDCGSIIHVRDTFQNDDGKYVRGCKTCRTELPDTGSIQVKFGPGHYGSVYTGLNHPTLSEVEELPFWNYSIGGDTYPARFVRRISKTRIELESLNHKCEPYEFAERSTFIVSRRKNGKYKVVGDNGPGGYWPHTEAIHHMDPHF